VSLELEWDIHIDPARCMGSCNCQFWAPNVFDLNEEAGVAYVVDPRGDDEEKVLHAAEACPTRAITVWRSGEQIAP
jgi:ferredoxin